MDFIERRIVFIDFLFSFTNYRKYMIIFEINGKRKVVHFGFPKSLNYPDYHRMSPKYAEERRVQFELRRHGRNVKNGLDKEGAVYSDPFASETLCFWLLWNKPTLKESLESYKKFFEIE